MKSRSLLVRSNSAFTLVELLVVIVVIALLAALSFPAFSKARVSDRSISCMLNKKRLTMAWTMYSEDNHGKLIPNHDLGPDWVQGWLDFTVNNTNNTNVVNLQNSKICAYEKDVGIFKCPSDTFPCRVGASNLPRVRSVSMNGFIEGGAYQGQHDDFSSHWYPNYCSYQKMIDIKNPKPSMLWVFTDEHPDSIGDGWMINDPTDPNRWIDFPASYHNGSGVFGFADGHTEIKRWLEASTCIPVQMIQYNSLPAPNSRDVKWMIERSSAHPH